MKLRRYYTVIDTGDRSRSYAGVIMGIDWSDAMGTAARILRYPDTYVWISIYECDVHSVAIPGGDWHAIRA